MKTAANFYASFERRVMIGDDLDYAAELLQRDHVVAFPTETVYGLGGNALSASAVAKIFAAKDRPLFDPLIVHIASLDQVESLITSMHPTARQLMHTFWPGPLTILFPKSDLVPDLVTSGLPEVGLRMPAHPLALDLIQRAGVPLAAPSANLFGRISPTTAEHVADQLDGRIDYILDGGTCRVGVESTIARVHDEKIEVLRLGGVTLEELQRACDLEVVPVVRSVDERTGEAMSSPGLLTSHYAPQTRLVIAEPELLPSLMLEKPTAKFGLLVGRPLLHDPGERVIVEHLSPSGDLVEMAANFFAALRRLDAQRLDTIFATGFPNEGLGRALNDRLIRAAAKYFEF